MKKTIPTLFAATLLTCTFSEGIAANLKSRAPSKGTADKTRVYASTPLDLTVDSLPKQYMGHSCRAFAKNMASLNLQKGEFESTTAYKQRLESLSTSALAGTTTLGDIVGFVLSDDVFSTITGKYDADRQTLNLSYFWGGNTQSVGSELLTTVKVDLRPERHRSYQASNAYGATVSVSSSTYDTCGLALSNFRYLTLNRTNIDESVPIDLDEARQAKGNLAVMFVGNMEAPYRVDFHDFWKATIDSPTQVAFSGDALIMRLAQIWIFNKQNGKIYKKIDVESGKQ